MNSDKETSAAAPPCQPPWLVYYNDKDNEEQTLVCCENLLGPLPVNTYRKNVPSLHGKKVLSCSYGYLVLYDNKTNLISLCNSTNFDAINLPSLELSLDEIDSCVLSSRPENPVCKVLLFLKKTPSIMCCGLSDDDKWSEIKYGNQLKSTEIRRRDGDDIYDGSSFLARPVNCNGKIYAIMYEKGCSLHSELWSIKIFEEEEEAGVVIENWPETNHELSCRPREYLVESNGELFLLEFTWSRSGSGSGSGSRDVLKKIELRRLNLDTMVWKRVESIKDRSFLVCPNYCLSCPVNGSGYIYFFKHEDPSLYCYNMDDESVLASLPYPNLNTPCLSPIWVMPQVPCPNDISNKEQRDTRSLELQKNEEKQLYGLPFDIQHEILKRLTPHDYLNLGSVSRLFRTMAPREKWKTAQLGFPLLMNTFIEGDQSHYNLISNSNQIYQMKTPNLLTGALINYSNHGWLLMANDEAVHLYNPFTKDIVSYTPSPDNSDDSYFFISEPSRSAFLLIDTSFIWRDDITIRYPKASEWTTSHIVNPSSSFDFKTPAYSPVFFQDAYWFLDPRGYLGILNLKEGNNSWEVIKERPIKETFYQNFLVECGGELLLVFIGRTERWVRVVKFNQGLGFERVMSLGGYSLYVSKCSSFSVVASPGEENRIYFPRYSGCGFVFHSLDTRKTHFIKRHGSCNHACDSCWIMPSWR